MEFNINTVNKKFENAIVEDILKWCYEHFAKERIKLSTSFGAEGIILLSIMSELVTNPKIFTIDTGRNFQETYDIWQEVVDRFHVNIETFMPNSEDINKLLNSNGPNLFYSSAESRKQCCYVRKVKPLQRALKDVDVWITGIRRNQTGNRADIPYISWIEEYQVYKICPLANWKEENIWNYISNNGLPYNKLYDHDYDTIGCMPCTRPVINDGIERSGRWWWEKNNEKECGIHLNNNKEANINLLIGIYKMIK